MTMQISDTYEYQGKIYYPIRRKGKLEFHPNKYGLSPHGVCSNCWSGYFCEYEIAENTMHLNKLSIHQSDDIYPELNGVLAQKTTEDDTDCCYYRYEELYLPITGRGTCRMLLGSDYIGNSLHELNDFWNYATLQEFVFKNGVLVEVNDYSAIATSARKIYQKDISALIDMRCKNKRKFLKEILPKNHKGKQWWIELDS